MNLNKLSRPGKALQPLLLIIFLVAASQGYAQCITPPDQTFGTYVDNAYGPSVEYECITYTGSNVGGVQVGIGNTISEGISSSPLFSGSAAVIAGLSGGGYAELRSTNGNEFAMWALVADFYGHGIGDYSEVYNIVGYRDGNEVVRLNGLNITTTNTIGAAANIIAWQRHSYDLEGNNSGVLTFGTAWHNIDMLRFYVAEPPPFNFFFIGIDDIDFEAATVLPVRYGEVSAFVADSKLQVNWSTLSETNNDRFEVQLSQDGETFTTIKTLSSNAVMGNSDRPIDYEITLELPQTGVKWGAGLLLVLLATVGFSTRKWRRLSMVGIGCLLFSACNKESSTLAPEGKDIFLRIKQVDKDGTSSYSKTIKVIYKN